MKIFENAEFISCEDENRIFSKLVVKDGQIAFSGDQLPDQYKDAERINLHGQCVVPAFGDSHIHFSSFAFFHSGMDCRDAKDFDELGVMIRQYISLHPKEKVVLAFGSSAHTVKEKRLPQKDDLDQMTSHPVMIVKYDGHAAVGNSALIKKMPESVIDDPGFDPDTGWFHLEAFYKSVNIITKSVSLIQFFKNLISGSHFLAQNGIGLVHAVEGVGFPLDLDVDLTRLASLGLSQDYRIYFQTMDVKKVMRRKMPRIGGCFATALDGSFGSEDAAFRKPYSNNPNNSGALFYSQEEINQFIGNAHQKGLQVSVHAIGDAAIQQGLTAFEKAISEFPRNDHRHVLIHGCLMDGELMDKTAEMGIGIALQPPLLLWDHEPVEYLETILGNRVKKLMPLKSMVDRGIILAGGSDGPCSIPDPIFGIHAACNHPNPDESVSVLDALKMYTINCAKLSFDDRKKGTLTPGKDADFVILDQNILNLPKEKIKEISVQDLYLRGEKYKEPGKGIIKFLATCIKNKLFSGYISGIRL